MFNVGDIAYANSSTKLFFGIVTINNNCIVQITNIKNDNLVMADVVFSENPSHIGLHITVCTNDISKIGKLAVKNNPRILSFAVSKKDIFIE